MNIPRYDYRIASGYNQPIGSLVNIETIVPSGDKAFYPPASYGEYDPGDFKVRGNGGIYISGYASTSWRWTGNPGGRMTMKQARYLMDHYAGGSYQGTVTIYTPLDTPGTYQRCNAVINLPKLPEAGKNFNNFNGYAIRFTRIGTLD